MYDFALISTLLIYLTYFPKKVGHNSPLDDHRTKSQLLFTQERIPIVKSLTKKEHTIFNNYMRAKFSKQNTIMTEPSSADHCVCPLACRPDALATYSSPNQSLLVRMNGKLLRMSDNALYCLKLRNRLVHISI